MTKNDKINEIESEQRRLAEKQNALADRLAELRKEPESVKPRIDGVYQMYTPGFQVKDDKLYVRLAFDTKEQAEKAKAILEKMEFGPMPYEAWGDDIEYLGMGGAWHTWGSSHPSHEMLVAAWRHGALRKKA